MHVVVSVQLGQDEPLAKTPDDLAAAILKSVGGDKERDLVTVHVQRVEIGQAGTHLPESGEE
jgi:hypothetical protein